jgi:hypothetical protein
MTRQNIAKLGAAALRAKFASDAEYRQHMSEIGKLGYKAVADRYQLCPAGTSGWCLVNRKTGKIFKSWGVQ